MRECPKNDSQKTKLARRISDRAKMRKDFGDLWTTAKEIVSTLERIFEQD
jgi:hypothetical protein